jgi:hypothetical protein
LLYSPSNSVKSPASCEKQGFTQEREPSIPLRRSNAKIDRPAFSGCNLLAFFFSDFLLWAEKEHRPDRQKAGGSMFYKRKYFSLPHPSRPLPAKYQHFCTAFCAEQNAWSERRSEGKKKRRANIFESKHLFLFFCFCLGHCL